MDSRELYAVLLGLGQPWTVERVQMDVARQEVSVYVTHPPRTRFRCPRRERDGCALTAEPESLHSQLHTSRT